MDLANVARANLETQHRLWPELDKKGILAGLTNEVIAGMVAEYKVRHQTVHIDAAALRSLFDGLVTI